MLSRSVLSCWLSDSVLERRDSWIEERRDATSEGEGVEVGQAEQEARREVVESKIELAVVASVAVSEISMSGCWAVVVLQVLGEVLEAVKEFVLKEVARGKLRSSVLSLVLGMALEARLGE